MSDKVISGYHGFANSGDEALLWAILNTLKQKSPDISVTVLSKTPEETARDYGVKSVNRYNFFKIRKEMKQAKMLIFGGGSLLQDVTSSKSLKYYLMIIALAESCGLKTMLYANGIGPIRKRADRRLTARILNRVDLITLRDDKSDEELKKLGREDIVVIVGGVIPAQDYDELYRDGAAAIFGPGTPISTAAIKILETLLAE